MKPVTLNLQRKKKKNYGREKLQSGSRSQKTAISWSVQTSAINQKMTSSSLAPPLLLSSDCEYQGVWAGRSQAPLSYRFSNTVHNLLKWEDLRASVCSMMDVDFLHCGKQMGHSELQNSHKPNLRAGRNFTLAHARKEPQIFGHFLHTSKKKKKEIGSLKPFTL